MSSSRIVLCMFLLLITSLLLHTEATFRQSPSLAEAPSSPGTVFGCNPSPCQTKCCLCTVVRTRPVCARCCEEDDETQPGGLHFPPKIAPINSILNNC